MTRRAHHPAPQHWHIISVPVRQRKGPERLRQAYRLLLRSEAAEAVPEVLDLCQHQSQGSEGA